MQSSNLQRHRQRGYLALADAQIPHVKIKSISVSPEFTYSYLRLFTSREKRRDTHSAALL